MARKALLCSALLACAMALALPYALAEESFSQSATIGEVQHIHPGLCTSFSVPRIAKWRGPGAGTALACIAHPWLCLTNLTQREPIHGPCLCRASGASAAP